MIKRVKLADRLLPEYSPGEELTNTLTHALGGLASLPALFLCLAKAIGNGGATEITASAIYGSCLLLLYSISSIYHGLRPGTAKRVMQVLDHCAIYFLIAGSYTIISLGAIRRANPALGWGLFAAEWVLCAVAATLTAIDLKRYRVFSVICYIAMGWAVLPFAGILREILTVTGFRVLLAGGIVYTIGAIIYGIGSRVRWLHSVFHIFVVAGSILHFWVFYFFGI